MATFANVYSPVKTSQLKSTTAKAIASFWENELKNLNIDYKTNEPGVVATIEHLGANYLVDKFQPYATDNGELAEGFELYSLGELAASREHEQELIQFEVQTSKVETFLNDSKTGLLRTHHLYMPIEILRIVNDDDIIGGGRHRTTGLLTLCKFIEGYENLNVAVQVREVPSRVEALNYIQCSNGSRNMTPFEKTKLSAAASGMSVVRSGAELLEAVTPKSGLTDIGNVAGLYFASEAASADVFVNQTPDTMGKIGKSFISNLSKQMKSIDSGADVKGAYLFESNGQLIVSALIKYAFDVLSKGWDAYLDSIKEPIKDRKTGQFKVDDNGETVYSINVSRSASHIAQQLAEGVFAELESELKQVFTSVTEAKAAEDQAKRQQKQAKQAQSQAQKADQVLDYLKSLEGVELPPEVLEQIKQQRAEAEAEAAQAAATPAPQQDASVAAQLDVLLS
jgi:hypothetical protein